MDLPVQEGAILLVCILQQDIIVEAVVIIQDPHPLVAIVAEGVKIHVLPAVYLVAHILVKVIVKQDVKILVIQDVKHLATKHVKEHVIKDVRVVKVVVQPCVEVVAQVG